MATYLSKNFTLEEMTSSDTARRRGIVNTCSAQAAVNLVHLCDAVLQPLRDWYGKPITIGSGFRCRPLNQAVGGASNSQHLTGQAVDLCIDGDLVKGKLWFEWIRSHCTFDQLIFEHNTKGSYWVHVSYVYNGHNRKQVIENMLQK